MDSSSIEKQKFLIITASGTDYCIPVSDVEGVTTLHRSDISPVPVDTQNRFRGLFSYKGSVMCLLHCAQLSAESYENDSDELKAVLMVYERKSFAVLVDGVKAVSEDMPYSGAPVINAKMLYTGEADTNDYN